MNAPPSLRVEVVYATALRQAAIEVQAHAGATIEEVIRQSGILRQFPEIDLACAGVGIFGEMARLDDAVRDRDRVEIYRPLIADPKEARRRRAARAKSKTSIGRRKSL